MKDETRRKLTCALALLAGFSFGPAVPVAAVSRDMLHDVSGEIASLRQARDEIMYYHQAQADVKRARADLAEAKAGLAEARRGRAEAAANLKQVRDNLAAVQKQLQAAQQALVTAQQISSQRTQQALAAQRAVAALAPSVWQAQAERDARQRQAEALQAQADALDREAEAQEAAQEADLEARRVAAVQQALAAVNYEQNRLLDAEDMVNDAMDQLDSDDNGTSREWEAQMEALSRQTEQAEAALEGAERRLDELQEQLDALVDAREQAEDAERDARETVREYTQEVADLKGEEAQGKKDVQEAAAYDAEAAQWLTDAEAWQQSALKESQRADYALAHFGEGAGWQTGLEYDSWHGKGSGYQLYVPYSFSEQGRIRNRRVDFGLTTGYITSDTHLSHDHVAGWTDTQISATLHNDHKQNSIRYNLTLNLPTGQSEFYQNSIVPEDLGRFTDFGSGFQVTPGIDVIHHFTERDSLTGSLQYTFRSSYEYSREVPGTRVNPGNVFRQELSYLHAGEKAQYRLGLAHTQTARSEQDLFEERQVAEAGEAPALGNLDHRGLGRPWQRAGRLSYKDGDDWEATYFYNNRITDRDELSFFGLWNLTGAASGYRSQAVHRSGWGAGWRHHMNKTMDWHVGAAYKDVTSGWDPLRRELNTGEYKYYSLLFGWSWQMGEKEKISLDGEHYRREEKFGDDYEGWKMLFTYNKTL